MQAIVQDRYGAPEQVLKLVTLDAPVPGPGEVLVRVRATSVNTPDWLATVGVPYFIRLVFGVRRPAARVRGSDLAGVVEAVGSGVTHVKPGDEVLGSSWTAGDQRRGTGTFAELAIAQAERIVPKPAHLTFEQAAAAVMSGLTAVTALCDVAELKAGQRVLINGASGGVGLFAIQVAKLRGAEVTAVCSGRNADLVRSVGADRVIDYTREDFTEGDQRYDVVLDDVLNRPPARVLKIVAPNGLYIPNSVGQGRWFGGLPRMAWAKVLGGRRVKTTTIEANRKTLGALAEWLAPGRLRVVIDRTYSLAEAGQAVAYMLSHRARGKVVIAVPRAT